MSDTSQTADCCTPGRASDQFPSSDQESGVGLATDRRSQAGTVAPASAGPSDSVLRHKEELVYLPGATFLMGTDDDEGFPEDGEGPVREITISGFGIDRHAVSNARFAEFVEETGYRTEAEEFGWSFVFQLFVSRKLVHKGAARKVPGLQWWYGVTGAYWRRPEGPGSSIADRMDHPVTHVSWADANAYATWAGRRLPTEAEWEYAGRGGLEQRRFVWGDELVPDGHHQCNIWQGVFPKINSREDGFAGTCPVDTYEPNGYGLYTMAGNVWEWCSDWWSSDFHVSGPRIDPAGPAAGTSRVMRGGSYLCHHSYCNRYRVAARTANTPDSSTGNLGFRTAVNWRNA